LYKKPEKIRYTDEIFTKANHINVVENKTTAKDYEILSYYAKNISGKGLEYVDPDYIWYETSKGNGKWSRKGHITSPYTTNEINNHNGYGIHSVKRLSDGQIFTVGDKCNLKNGNGYRNPIIKIELTKNGESGYLVEYRNRETIKITLGSYPDDKTPWGPFEFDKIVKSEQPLFKTEDGVDIFEGDTIFGVNIDWKVFSHYTDLQNKVKSWGIKPIFSTKEKAEEYILMNKPCLSINDVMNAGYGICNPHALIKIVKSRT
jgi:hypothetical protein